MARTLNVGFIQILEPRPCGGFFRAGNSDLLSDGDRQEVRRFVVTANSHRRYRSYPIVHSVALAESPAMWGCLMGGLSHFHIDGRGNVNPCVFLPVTFGNITREKFPAIFKRMRSAVPLPLHTECPSLQLSEALHRLAAHAGATPVPYEAVRTDWREMVSRVSPSGECAE